MLDENRHDGLEDDSSSVDVEAGSDIQVGWHPLDTPDARRQCGR